MRTGRSFLACLIVVTCTASAAADPVRVVSSGNIVGRSPFFLGTTFTFQGTNFTLIGSSSEGGAVAGPFAASGGAVPLQVFWAGDSFNASSAVSPNLTIVDGVDYGTVWLAGYVQASGTAVLPSLASGTFATTFPFSLSPDTFVIGYADSMRTRQLFRFGLQGSGTGMATLLRVEDRYDVTALRFDFESPEPVPEPATIGLLGLGVATVVARARRRNRR
jgi:hypothetical protein